MRQFVLGTLVVALFTAGAAAEGEQWLQYRSSADPSARDASGGYAQLELVSPLPADLVLPKLVSDKPILARWKTPMAPAGFLWVLLDQSKKGGAYDRLFMDTSANGKLGDKSAIAADLGDTGRTGFGPIKITFPGADGPVTYHLSIYNFTYSGSQVRLYAQAACWYEGQVNVGGHMRRCLLVDSNTDGAFDKPGMIDDPDVVCLDGGQDGKQLAQHYVGKYLQLDGKLYDLEVPREGGWVKFTPDAQVPMASVRLPKGTAAVSLVGAMGHFIFEAPDESGLVRVPAGTKYQFESWTYTRKDEAGKLWTLLGRGTPPEKAFDLSADKEWAAPIGEPLTAALNVVTKNKEHTISLQLTDRLGDQSVNVMRGGGENGGQLGDQLGVLRLD